MSGDGAPLFERIAADLAELIGAGTLGAGARLPSLRRTGRQHRVSLTTAVQAYRLLEDRGLIEARPKSGFFVRARPLTLGEPGPSRPAPHATRVDVASLQTRLFDAVRLPEVAPLGAAYPSAAHLPTARLARSLAAMARRAGEAGLLYDLPPGCEALRREISRRALDAGARLPPDEFITTSGGTEALTLCLRAVTKPGDVVALESPTYFGLLQTVEHLGLQAVEIPMHPRDGLDLDVLERTLAQRKLAACVAVPNFSNPLGSLMPDAHQRRLVELLARREVPLIEDDINGELPHEGPRPGVAKRFDRHGLVLLCGSFSKTLAPGYRVGWVAPGRFYERVKALKLTSTLATATLPQMAVADFVANGGYDHHLRGLRAHLAEGVRRLSAAVSPPSPPVRG